MTRNDRLNTTERRITNQLRGTSKDAPVPNDSRQGSFHSFREAILLNEERGTRNEDAYVCQRCMVHSMDSIRLRSADRCSRLESLAFFWNERMRVRWIFNRVVSLNCDVGKDTFYDLRCYQYQLPVRHLHLRGPRHGGAVPMVVAYFLGDRSSGVWSW